MKISSFISDQKSLVPVEVELTLWPGLPTIQFLGLPDQHLRESALRIKSAIKAQGFEFPKSQQILVNLRPSHLKKTSRGLELAVAAAYLWETGQAPPPLRSENYFVYGELNLSGEVFEPEDLPQDLPSRYVTVLTGVSDTKSERSYTRQTLKSLQQMQSPDLLLPVEKIQKKFIRPKLPELRFSKDQAEILAVAAVGEHSCLLAGPAGSGKTTLAKALHLLLRKPEDHGWSEIVETQKKFGLEIDYPPLVKPHHTTPLISMVGGGAIPMAGEISRAHGGLLLLDEFLEFKPQIQEALREPLEEGVIRVARAGKYQIFPARSLCVATSNLCPCGDFVPGARGPVNCRFTRTRCMSYREKLSGPILDRFQIVYFSVIGGKKEISLTEILENVQRARVFQQEQRSGPAQWESVERIESTLSEFRQKRLQEMTISERRRNAILRTARSLSDLQGKIEITAEAWDRAHELSLRPFEKIKKWDL
jgi:magnesium chelatase family protein